MLASQQRFVLALLISHAFWRELVSVWLLGTATGHVRNWLDDRLPGSWVSNVGRSFVPPNLCSFHSYVLSPIKDYLPECWLKELD